MVVSYNRLWHLLLDRHMSKTELRKVSGVSTNVIAKLGRDETISMDSLAKICVALDCEIEDIMEINVRQRGVRA